MTNRTRAGQPLWVTVAGVLLLFWAIGGCYVCMQHIRLGPDAFGVASEYDRQLFANIPSWYDWCYALAVFSGFGGAVALLLRARGAVALYLLSLAAVLVQFGWLFAMTDIVAYKGVVAVMPFPTFVIGMGVGQVALAYIAMRRGWID